MIKSSPRTQLLQKHKHSIALKCPKPSHNDSLVKYVCTAPSCDQDLLCDLCLSQDHNQGHQENILHIEDLLTPDLGKNPIKKLKIEANVKKTDSIKDLILRKSSIMKAYSQAIKEEFQKSKEQIEQLEETFKQFLITLRKKLELSYAKLVKDLKTQFNIFEYSALRIPKIRSEIESICFKDSQEYKSVLTSIIELEKAQSENVPEFVKQLGESFSLDDSCSLLSKTANMRPVSPDNVNIVNRLEHELQIIQQNILEIFPKEKKPTKEKIRKEISLPKPGNKIFDYVNATLTNTLLSVNRITAVAIVEATKIAVGSESGVIEYWNLNNQMIIQKTNAHTGTIKGLVAVNKKTIVSGSRDSFIKVFLLPTLECTQKISAHNQGLNSLAKFENSGIVVSGGMDNQWKVWDTQTGKMLYSKTNGLINCVQVFQSSVRDKLLWEKKLSITEGTKENLSAVGIGGKKEIYLWIVDVTGAREPYAIYTLKGHEKEIRAMVAMDANTLVSAGSDFAIRIWDLKDGSCKKTIQKAHTSFITNLGFVENDIIVSAGLDGEIKFWNLTKGLELKSLNAYKSLLYCLEFDGKGAMITAGDGQLIRIWK